MNRTNDKVPIYYDMTILNKQVIKNTKNKLRNFLQRYLKDIKAIDINEKLTIGELDKLMPDNIPNVALINEIIKQTFHKSIMEAKQVMRNKSNKKLEKEMDKFNKIFHAKTIPKDIQTIRLRESTNKISELLTNKLNKEKASHSTFTIK